MADFETSFAMLNAAQREAVEHIDGPLLVIAGPGTGKTQLLSLRAANILRNRDVEPKNILCLTYTDAGAEAMKKRLIELIGRDGYGIEVSTFHSFASACKSRYPEYFLRPMGAQVASELHKKKVLDECLKALPYDGPLAGVNDGVASSLGAVSSFISNMKRQGLTPDEFRAIMRQNIDAADYLDGCEEFVELLQADIPRAAAAKAEFIQRFEEVTLFVCNNAPKELKTWPISASGICKPYILWLKDRLQNTELMVGNRTTGFTELRNAITKKDADGVRFLNIREKSEKGLVAADVYEQYGKRLAEENLYDFDDMIMDFIAAVENHPEFRYVLQDRYQYVQVDEFQDTNGAQMRIVDALCGGKLEPNVMAVGDDDQAIMRFQGASIECINQFRERYNPASVVLKTNYRSTPEVVGLGQDIAVQIENRLQESVSDKDIVAFRPSGSQVKYGERVFASKELEYLALARDIRERIDAGFIENAKDPDEAIAVLACKHDTLRDLIPYLKAENVPFSYKENSELFTMESMQTTLALLRFVAKYSAGRVNYAMAHLPQIVAAPELGLSREDAIRFAIYAKKEHHGDWIAALKETETESLRNLYDDLMEWCAQAPAAPVRELIFGITSRCRAYYVRRSETDPLALAEYTAGIRALLRFVEAELETAGALGRAMRLADVVEQIDQAARFGIKIDASISLGAKGAVRLLTAHGSKGLEFDLVYVADAEQKMWRKSAPSADLYTENLLIGNKKDEDDVRRLLFVAVTRAKDYLELFRAEGTTICELADLVESEEEEPCADDLAAAVETSWLQTYEFETPELRALLAPVLPPWSLSASALNTFVLYSEKAEELGAMRFPQERVLRIPDEPKIFFAYGDLVHKFFEEYVNRIIIAGELDDGQLALAYREEISRMDFAPEDVQRYARQFDRIVEVTVPWMQEQVTGFQLATEAKLTALVGDNVPLFGYCDLLLIDDEAKEIRVVDYKTGLRYPKGEPDRAYQRQLQFYRLLIENSEEYRGYHVVSCENWYVEPDRDTHEVNPPVASSVSDADIAYLTTLINAAWHRIAAGDFDTLAFEASCEKVDAVAAYEASKGQKSKAGRLRALQPVYEQWLISQDA